MKQFWWPFFEAIADYVEVIANDVFDTNDLWLPLAISGYLWLSLAISLYELDSLNPINQPVHPFTEAVIK